MKTNRFKLFGIVALIAMIGFAFAGCSIDDSTETSVNPGGGITKSVTVGTQNGGLTQGLAGSATFTVTTENIDNGSSITLNNIDSVEGISLEGTPVTTDDSTTVTVKTTAAVAEGSYQLSLTIDGTTSAEFTLTVSPANTPVITINTQPAATTIVTQGSISGSLTVAATVTHSATLSYQWYSNTTASNSGGTPVQTGGTGANFTIPTALTQGAYYYFCEVKVTDGTVSVRSSVATFNVNLTPVAGDFTVGNLTQTTGNVVEVTITANSGKSTGAVSNIRYNNSRTVPQAVGTYPVIFDVEAATGWNAATNLSAGTLTVVAANQTPVATDYTFGNMSQTVGSVTAITITPNSGKSPGAVSNIRYNNSTTIPQTAGSYTVTFDVAAATGWNAATNLSAGNLVVTEPVVTFSGVTANGSSTQTTTQLTLTFSRAITGLSAADISLSGVAGVTKGTLSGPSGSGPVTYTLPVSGITAGGTLNVAVAKAGYTVNGSPKTATVYYTPVIEYVIIIDGGRFTATRGGTTVVTNSYLEDLITGIRTNANGSDCVIQFGDGTNELTYTGATVFNNTGGTWGHITLRGRLRGNVSDVIRIADDVSITSFADITNTSNASNTTAIRHNGTGTLTITGGTISVIGGRAVHNAGTGTVNISGGTVSASAISGVAVYNTGTGTITVSGTDTIITSANTNTAINTAEGTIYLGNSGTETAARLTITGGTVQNTSTGNAIYNNSTGAINISGGMVSATTGSAVYNNTTGTITVSGANTIITSEKTGLTTGTIHLVGTGPQLTVTGGTVRNTTTTGAGIAIFNDYSGNVDISGGTISTTASTGNYAIRSIGKGIVTIGPGATIVGNRQVQ